MKSRRIEQKSDSNLHNEMINKKFEIAFVELICREGAQTRRLYSFFWRAVINSEQICGSRYPLRS